MLYKYLAGFFCAVCAIVMLTSCGDSKAGGTGEFATVFATANAPATSLDSHVATATPDDVVYTVTSSAYAVPNTGSSSTTAPSELSVDKITVTLTPANTSTPALPVNFQTQFPSSGQRIVVGTNNVPVRIVDGAMKTFLQGTLTAGVTFSYRAVVSFEALELSTNRVATITAPGFLVVNLTNP